MSGRTLAQVLLVVSLGVGWPIAALVLWHSSVPGSLHLPHVDPHAYFSDSELRRVSHFSRINDFLWWGTTITQLLVLALYARFGGGFARESAAGPLGTGMLLGMLGFAFVWVVELPFGVFDLWWQRRHHLTSSGYVVYLFGDWFQLGATFVFLCVALAVVMGFARWLGSYWWLAAAPVFIGLVLLFAFLSPYLTPTHALDDPVLAANARHLEVVEHVQHVPIVVEDMRDVTSMPNAEAMGLGVSRRVVLWDTLVDGRFSEGELKVVVGHELGHLAHHHIWKDVGWYAFFAFPGTWLIAQTTRRRGGMGQAAAVPLGLLALVVLSLVALPLQNSISRHLEAEADWSALQATHDPADATALFKQFVPTTLDEPSPSSLDYVLLENHPTIMQRIAMVKAWQRYTRSHP